MGEERERLEKYGSVESKKKVRDLGEDEELSDDGDENQEDEAAIRPVYKQLGIILPEEIEERAWGSMLTPFPWYLQFSEGLKCFQDYDYDTDPLGVRIRIDRYGETSLLPIPGQKEVP